MDKEELSPEAKAIARIFDRRIEQFCFPEPPPPPKPCANPMGFYFDPEIT